MGKGAGFFVLSLERWRRVWAVPTNDRLDLIIVYLLLLAGTDSDQVETTWSRTAIMNRVGMNKLRAGRLIGELMAAGLVTAAEPQGEAPSAGRRASRYSIVPFADGEDPIFLPMGLVNGLGGNETPLLRRVRQLGSDIALALLLELYGHVSGDASLAVDPSVYRAYPRGLARSEGHFGANRIWSVRRNQGNRRLLYLPNGVLHDLPMGARSKALSALQSVGALYDEPWVCGGSAREPEPLFPWSPRISELADKACRRLLSEFRRSPAASRIYFALPSHVDTPQVLSLLRFRIEAQTSLRAAAYVKRLRIEDACEIEFKRLALVSLDQCLSSPLRVFV